MRNLDHDIKPLPQADDSAFYSVENYPVLLGRLGNFSYHGNPETGHVASIATSQGCKSSGFGGVGFWRGHLSRYGDRMETTAAGRRWREHTWVRRYKGWTILRDLLPANGSTRNRYTYTAHRAGDRIHSDSLDRIKALVTREVEGC